MKKNTPTQPKLTEVSAMQEWKRERCTLPFAYDMAGHSIDTIRQLQGIASMIATAKPGTDADTERQHLLVTMELFAANLDQVYQNIDEVMVVLRHLEPKITAAANS